MTIAEQIEASDIPQVNRYVAGKLCNIVTASESDHQRWQSELMSLGCTITMAKRYMEHDLTAEGDSVNPRSAWTIHAFLPE